MAGVNRPVIEPIESPGTKQFLRRTGHHEAGGTEPVSALDGAIGRALRVVVPSRAAGCVWSRWCGGAQCGRARDAAARPFAVCGACVRPGLLRGNVARVAAQSACPIIIASKMALRATSVVIHRWKRIAHDANTLRTTSPQTKAAAGVAAAALTVAMNTLRRA